MSDSDSDHIREAIAKIIADDDHEPHLIGAVTLIAEMVGPDGKNYLFHLTSTDMTVWKERGMLMYRLDMLSGGTTLAEFERNGDTDG